VWLYVVIGVATAAVILALDQFLFAGASLPRIRALGAESVPTRLLVVLASAFGEELIYRVFLSALLAWLALLAFARFTSAARPAAVWFGIAASAVLFGLSHAANVTNIAHPVVRALVLNGPSGVVLGWLYWRRGIEAAITAHLSADTFIYLIVANTI
jgi:hypothetical protein